MIHHLPGGMAVKITHDEGDTFVEIKCPAGHDMEEVSRVMGAIWAKEITWNCPQCREATQ